MYCKKCGHRSDQIGETCPKCGAKVATEVAIERAPQRKIRWGVFVAASLIGVVAFVVVPRFFFRPELENIGPTDKLKFLRAMENSQYRKVGQREIRLDQQTLVVIWDLRWNTLPEKRQQEIVRMVGHAWNVVGGHDTRFRIEGEDKDAAAYVDGKVNGIDDTVSPR